MSGPAITRPNPATYFIKPGLHSHNTRRRLKRTSLALSTLSRLRVALLAIGICAIAYYGYSLSDQYIYQAYQNWAFDQQIAGRPAVSFADYLREQTPFAFLVGEKRSAATSIATVAPVPNSAPGLPGIPQLTNGALLGRVEISRLNLSAMVREGVDAKTLGIAVGHVPSTALPGQTGNFAIAAHRDTLFRALKDIKKGDVVSFESPAGTYNYEVAATKIVKPSDISVLQADGGGLIPREDSSAPKSSSSDKLLTMITCYPFYYVGAAPKRFIVEAKLVSTDAAPKLASAEPPSGAIAASAAAAEKPRATKRANAAQLHRPSHPAAQPSKRRNLWHKLWRRT